MCTLKPTKVSKMRTGNKPMRQYTHYNMLHHIATDVVAITVITHVLKNEVITFRLQNYNAA